MALGRRFAYEEIRTSDTSTATSYQVIGGPLEHPASLVKMVNLSNKDIFISTDGSTDEDICPSNGFWLYDVTANSSQQSDAIFEPKGKQYYIKTVDGAAGSGDVYLVVKYIEKSSY